MSTHVLLEPCGLMPELDDSGGAMTGEVGRFVDRMSRCGGWWTCSCQARLNMGKIKV